MGLPSLRGTFQIVPIIYFQRSTKDVVHDAKVNLFLHLIFLPVENDFVEPINSRDQRISIFNGQVIIVGLQYGLH